MLVVTYLQESLGLFLLLIFNRPVFKRNTVWIVLQVDKRTKHLSKLKNVKSERACVRAAVHLLFWIQYLQCSSSVWSSSGNTCIPKSHLSSRSPKYTTQEKKEHQCDHEKSNRNISHKNDCPVFPTVWLLMRTSSSYLERATAFSRPFRTAPWREYST